MLDPLCSAHEGIDLINKRLLNIWTFRKIWLVVSDFLKHLLKSCLRENVNETAFNETLMFGLDFNRSTDYKAILFNNRTFKVARFQKIVI